MNYNNKKVKAKVIKILMILNYKKVILKKDKKEWDWSFKM